MKGNRMHRDVNLYQRGNGAVAQLMRVYRRGSYRAIRDPEGVISFWAIEGLENSAFSLSFANKGRISYNLQDMPPEFVKALIAFCDRIGRR